MGQPSQINIACPRCQRQMTTRADMPGRAVHCPNSFHHHREDIMRGGSSLFLLGVVALIGCGKKPDSDTAPPQPKDTIPYEVLEKKEAGVFHTHILVRQGLPA